MFYPELWRCVHVGSDDGGTAFPSAAHAGHEGYPPGYEAILFVRAMVEHPAAYGPLLAPFTQGPLLPSMKSSTLGIRKDDRFRGRSPTARTFACLRIAELVSNNGARLATGSGGLTLGRAGFAPAGRRTKFHGGITSSNSL